MAKEEADQDKDEQETVPGKSNLKVIIIAVVAAVLLSGGMVGATFYFVSGMNQTENVADDGAGDDGEEVVKEEEPLAPPVYHSLDPKFVVSFRDQRSARFMQFELDVMTRDEDTVKKLEEHVSAVRSSLLMLFDSQDYDHMSTREGKKELLLAVTKDVNETLDKMDVNGEKKASVEAAYFTSFVIQ